ncbi:unnamed protein product [Mytilus edulis]|uniref:Uncharacterized protein n=1 Tax=Mytilus edulis TaxID=6550 RepID=A0A8S3TVG4_MYTED|nr:unnamed protein product [Mytilus edulis]
MDGNPDLGYTDIVHHKICMKSDFKPKNQRPYRLPPDKKEALREHLDELLRQNIIAPVSETEDVPIISPIVLVSKQDRNKKQQENSQKSSAKYRFCCDFRYLNSQVQDFSYFIPDLTELTESFSGKNTEISVPSTDRSSDDQSTVLNEHDSDIFNLTTDVNTDQDNQMRRQVEMIDLFERSDFSVESLKRLQQKDSEYGKFVSYLDKGELPKSQKEARKLLFAIA